MKKKTSYRFDMSVYYKLVIMKRHLRRSMGGQLSYLVDREWDSFVEGYPRAKEELEEEMRRGISRNGPQ